MDYNIGIDIGTSSVKVLAVDQSGETIALEKRHYPILSPQRGYKEQNPETIWIACLTALSAVRNRFTQPPLSIGVSSAMHSLMLLSKEFKPLTNVILWADTRSQELAEELYERAEGEQIYKATGTPIHALSPLLKIRWIKENDLNLFRQTAYFVDIKTYILYHFCGELFMDYSMASSTGLFNLFTLSWNEDSLAYASIKPHQLPKLVDTSFFLPGLKKDIASQLNIPTTTPWIIGGSDGCLANLGSFSFDSDTLVASAGTSAALRYTCPAPLLNYEGQLFCYYLDPDRMIVGGASNNGGVVLNWFKENFYAGEKMEKLLKDAQLADPTADGLIFLPWLLGERAPIWDSKASGVFLGMRDTHDRTHFARAVLEGLVLNLFRIYQDVKRNNESGVTQVISGGGLAQSALWNQLLADIFNLPVQTMQETETSAFGAILMAQKATGQISDYAEIAHWQTIKGSFQPNEENNERYERFSTVVFQLYDQLKTMFRTIDRL